MWPTETTRSHQPQAPPRRADVYPPRSSWGTHSQPHRDILSSRTAMQDRPRSRRPSSLRRPPTPAAYRRRKGHVHLSLTDAADDPRCPDLFVIIGPPHAPLMTWWLHPDPPRHERAQPAQERRPTRDDQQRQDLTHQPMTHAPRSRPRSSYD